MHPIRSARRVRGLTIIELAQQSGVPARIICMFEQGMLPLDSANAERLATALALPITLLMRATDQKLSGTTHLSPFSSLGPQRLFAIALLFATLLVGTAIAAVWPIFSPVPRVDASAARPASVAMAAIIPATIQPEQTPVAAAIPIPTSTQRPNPSATVAPILAVVADGSPRACPLLAEPQRVVITQGYGEGTHAPINIAGAIDLGIDTDHDGYAEPDSTSGVVILATQNGIARVWLGSWPGGNVIRIVDEQRGWNTLYAHLADVSVTDGQAVTAGMPIGTVGSTGMSSGPHLHYEIWHYGENLNPTDMAPCWQMGR